MEYLYDLSTVIRFMDLPFTVKAFTVYDPCEDFYNVFVNKRLTSFEQEKAIKHEIEHIKRGHFTTDNGRDVSDIEWEMNALWHPGMTA